MICKMVDYVNVVKKYLSKKLGYARLLSENKIRERIMELFEKIFNKKNVMISALVASGITIFELLLIVLLPSTFVSMSGVLNILNYVALLSYISVLVYYIKLIVVDKAKNPLMYGYIVLNAVSFIISVVYMRALIAGAIVASTANVYTSSFGYEVSIDMIIAALQYTSVGKTLVMCLWILALTSGGVLALTILDKMGMYSLGGNQENQTATDINLPKVNIDTNKIMETIKKPIVLKGIIGAVGVVVVLVIGSTVIGMLNKDSINLTQGLTVEFTGQDGDGRYNVTSYELTGYDINDINQRDFINSIDFDYPQVDGLSNGDEITINAVYDKAKAEELGYNIKGESITFKVEGLTPVLRSMDQLTPEMIEYFEEAALEEVPRHYPWYGVEDLEMTFHSSYLYVDSEDIDSRYYAIYIVTGKNTSSYAESEEYNEVYSFYTGHIDLSDYEDTNITATRVEVEGATTNDETIEQYFASAEDNITIEKIK